MNLYPLIFEPRFVEKIWGGRKLQTILGKDLPPQKQIGESWEIYDFPPGVVDGSRGWVSSVVANGKLAGRTLHELVEEFGSALLGNISPVGPKRQFPLLIKFLDAREDLSVQVHPDQAYANANPGAHLKTEAWYVIHHDPGARLFAGLRPGATREVFGDAISRGTVEAQLRTIAAENGQSLLLPSGTVHALGAGILVAEVQTPSDTTFRVHDFNRIESSTGKPRTLHVEQAMQCIRFEEDSDDPSISAARSGAGTLIRSPSFSLSRIVLPPSSKRTIVSDQPTIFIALDGSTNLAAGGMNKPLQIGIGQTILLPAGVSTELSIGVAGATWLQVDFANNEQRTTDH